MKIMREHGESIILGDDGGLSNIQRKDKEMNGMDGRKLREIRKLTQNIYSYTVYSI